MATTFEATCLCGVTMELGVYHSHNGYYVGYWCKNCGPWDRASMYFSTRESAEKELEAMKRTATMLRREEQTKVLCFGDGMSEIPEAEIIIMASGEQLLELGVELVGLQYQEFQDDQPCYSMWLCEY